MTKTKTTTRPRWRLALALAGAAGVACSLGLGGCSAPAPSRSDAVLPLDKAVAQATGALLAQTQEWPASLGFLEPRRRIVIDPMIEVRSGQRTEATQLLQMLVREQLGAQPGRVELLPFRADGIVAATHVLTGTLAREIGGAGSAPVRVQLALTDLHSGKVKAQTVALARDDGLNNTPGPVDADSPVLPHERVIEGYVRTAAAPPGTAADSEYLQQLALSPLVVEAAAAYAAARYQDALALYDEVAARPGGEQLRVLSGRYLALQRLGRADEARAAFSRIVAFGLARRQLGVKLLFTPGSTDFWPDPQVSGQYPMWIGELAAGAGADSTLCMDIVGHTSRTGTEAFNDALSLQRASRIRELLDQQAPGLAGRTRADGKGFRENIIGSGTDNTVDALDRRVEFKVVACG